MMFLPRFLPHCGGRHQTASCHGNNTSKGRALVKDCWILLSNNVITHDISDRLRVPIQHQRLPICANAAWHGNVIADEHGLESALTEILSNLLGCVTFWAGPAGWAVRPFGEGRLGPAN